MRVRRTREKFRASSLDRTSTIQPRDAVLELWHIQGGANQGGVSEVWNNERGNAPMRPAKHLKNEYWMRKTAIANMAIAVFFCPNKGGTEWIPQQI